ncbi:hypothetical protein DL95DRAFT_505927 [Leptodontidium sp. 2 PMI_412]|nr:hypothetical protein BKA61DRAFT_729097 [Leptodontidium sp. MPI-SDFR-AT-0119]KAH9213744.1 hypothetical protein DL95DRAFT_505927 [Leptodontidium sp. 2 PMI_412]
MLSVSLFVLQVAFITGFGVQASPASSRPTAASDDQRVSGAAPQPTTPPDTTLIDDIRSELKERQYYGDICGYASGNIQLPVTCAVGMECAVNYNLGAMGCCPAGYLQSCQLATACIDYAYLGNCDFACQANYAIGKCNYQYPYCATYRSVEGMTTLQGYQCAASPGIVIPVETTLAAQEGELAPTPVDTPIINTITETYIPSDSATAAPIVNNYFYDNSTANKTEVTTPQEKKKGGGGLTKGELAGIIVGSVVGTFTIIGVLIQCCKD